MHTLIILFFLTLAALLTHQEGNRERRLRRFASQAQNRRPR